jgi:hypothetical protein
MSGYGAYGTMNLTPKGKFCNSQVLKDTIENNNINLLRFESDQHSGVTILHARTQTLTNRRPSLLINY